MYIRIPISFFLIAGVLATTNLEAQSAQVTAAKPDSVAQQQTQLPNPSSEDAARGTLSTQAQQLAQAEQTQSQIENIEFAKQAIERSEAQIKLAELALEKSENQTVRAFALQIISEHSSASEKLLEGSGDKELKPTTMLAASQQKIYERLEQLSTGEFDLAYIEVEIEALQSTLNLYRSEARKGNGSELEAIAARTLPKLEQQLVGAEDIKLTL